MRKKQLALEVIERLKKEYPDADCTLDYDEAWKLLVGVRLAAQCTDERVNIVVEKLYEKYPDVNALAAADVDKIEEIVRPCGLGKSKARDISACMKILRDEYGGNIPNTFDELLKTPWGWKKKCESHYGRCVWETGDCDRHTLYSSCKSHRACQRFERTEKSRDGIVENYSPQEGAILPQACIPWT